MAIRFRCRRCDQLLGIASRKAGTEIECPKCGAPQTVPSEKAAAAAPAMSGFSASAGESSSPSQVVVYNDDPTPIETSECRSWSSASDRSAGGIAGEGSGASSSPVPRGMILYRRRTLYIQGVLFVVLAVAFFAAGYLIGRANTPVTPRLARQEAAQEQLLVEGKVVYDPGNGLLAGDQGAVIVALPAGKFPEGTLPIQGIRPRDPPPTESNRSVRRIEQLGGGYARADDAGAFSLVLPQPGEYRLLLVSRHTSRPHDVEIDELDRDEMRQYFHLAEDLVGRSKYRWTLEEFRVGVNPITHDFGLDGQDGQDDT